MTDRKLPILAYKLFVEWRNGRTQSFEAIDDVISIQFNYDADAENDYSPCMVFSNKEAPAFPDMGDNWLLWDIWDYDKNIELSLNGYHVITWDAINECWIWHGREIEKLKKELLMNIKDSYYVSWDVDGENNNDDEED